MKRVTLALHIASMITMLQTDVMADWRSDSQFLLSDSETHLARASAQHIELSTDAGLRFSTPFSVGGWFKTDSRVGDGNMFTLFSMYNAVRSPPDGYTTYINQAGKVVFNFHDSAGNNPSIVSAAVCDDGAWHFHVGVWDGQYLRLYIDGQLQGSPVATPYGPKYYSTHKPGIGAVNTYGSLWVHHFDGLVRSFFVTSRALSSTEITEAFNDTGPLNTELIAYYPFDGNANDESGGGNTVEVQGTTLTTDRFGNVDKALLFNGSSDRIETITPVAINPTQHSISAWIKMASYHYYHYETVVASEAYRFSVTWGGAIHGDWTDGGSYVEFQSPDVLSTDRWYHVSLTRDGTVERLYVNGQLCFETNGVSVSRPTSRFQIGADGVSGIGGTDWFEGAMDDVRIYNRALSASEVAQLYVHGGGIIPVKIILDTDLASDCDDLGTLAVLYALEDRGEAEILGIMCDVSDPDSPRCLEAVNTYYGRPDIPIGNLLGYVHPTCYLPYYNKYTEYIANHYKKGPNNVVHDAVGLYASLLESNDNVTIVAVGSLCNLGQLLLLHRDLVQNKVSKLVVMGGVYPTPPNLSLLQIGEHPEQLGCWFDFNFSLDPISAALVLNTWPTPIVFTGLGGDIRTGNTIRDRDGKYDNYTGLRNEAKIDKNNPIRMGYEKGTEQGRFDDSCRNNALERPSWDEIAVLYAVRGIGTNFKEVRGRNTAFVTPVPWVIAQSLVMLMSCPPHLAPVYAILGLTGVGNRFEEVGDGPHSYLDYQAPTNDLPRAKEMLAREIDGLITTNVRTIITFNPITRSVRVGGFDIPLTKYCTANAGQQITFESSDTGKATIVDGNKLHAVSTGTVVITASYAAETGCFRPATPVTQTVQVLDRVENLLEIDIPSLIIDLLSFVGSRRELHAGILAESSLSYTTTVSTITISGSAADDVEVAGVEWGNDRGGGGICVGTETWTATNIHLCPGVNIITFTVSDTSGKMSSQSVSVTYSPPDQQVPYVAITYPTSGASYTTRVSVLDIWGIVQDNEGIAGLAWTNSTGGTGPCDVSNTIWTADIPLLEGINIVTMTALDTSGNTGSAAVVVTYSDEPAAPELTVIGGLGSGRYGAGEQVTVYADMPPFGQVFDQWVGDVGSLASSSSSVTTVAMPDNDIGVTATYKAGIYSLHVDNGTGGGEFGAGATPTITAQSLPGQIFDQWLGNTNQIGSVTSLTTTVTMPGFPMTVMATYWPFSIDAFDPIAGENGAYYVLWAGAPNRNYRICYTTNLVEGSPLCLVSNLNATTVQCEYTLTNAPVGTAFFMMKVD